MASVDFKKCKAGTGDAGALLRHCDAQERLKHDHGNEHIDKSLTSGNRQGERSYRQTMAALRDRLAELDAAPGANRRRDRVEMYMLEVPVPAGYDPEAFAHMAVQEISAMYGERNILNWYLHVDEIHDYMDHGEIRTSLAHVHIPVVPEVGGRLCGKEFSSRARMIELNRRIDERAREMGGPGFLTGEHPRKRSVEELKIASYRDALEVAQEAEKRAQMAVERASRASEQYEQMRQTLKRVAASQPVVKRKIGGREVVEVSPDEYRQLQAAAATYNDAVEVLRHKEAIIRDAQANVDALLRKADIGILHYKEQAERFVADIKRMMAEPVKRQPSRSRTRSDRDTPER